MHFGGLQKTSLIDYPDKISCVLFLCGCNFDCPFCHNPQLARGGTVDPLAPDPDRLYRFLDNRRSFLEGVVISGGEPTLQPDLPSLCTKLKQLGYPVKLDTNGSRPRVIQNLINDGLVDYIAMDIKTDPLHYGPLMQEECAPDCILESIRVIMKSASAYEFRTTCVKPLVSAGAIEEICRLIRGADLYVLQHFRNDNVLHPEFFCDMNPAFTEDELEQLQSIAAPCVKKCVIR